MSENGSEQAFKVFISSTSKDLQEWRNTAKEAILAMGWHPECMEYFEAMPTPTVEACYKKLSGCNLMVLIVGWKKGSTPNLGKEFADGDKSYTAIEYEFAQKKGIDVLIFMADDEWPYNKCDQGADLEWVKKFRQSLNKPAKFFEFEKGSEKRGFLAELKNSLATYKAKNVPPTPPILGAFSQVKFDQISESLQSGKSIPFLGCGVYEEGPLSAKYLIRAFNLKSPETCLATAAEFKEQFIEVREDFISLLGKIIEIGAQAIKNPPAIYDLLVKIKNPPLIVSATIDLLLEERLTREGKPPLIFCHVLSSEDLQYKGKVLQFEGPDDNNPKFLPADKIYLDEEISRGRYVIYKPLGSPCLNQRLAADKKIDTVVITERDLLNLIGWLQIQGTGVPTPFTKYFRDNQLIFFGYPMDVWHFRLVGQVLQDSLCPEASKRTPCAVRVPLPGLEELAWKRLKIEPLQMSCNQFAQKIIGKSGETA